LTEVFKHEKLNVWKASIEFAVLIAAVSRSFPKEEINFLGAQIRKAAFSVAANLAEGAGRKSDKDFSRFVSISYGSLMEVLTHVEIAHRLDYIKSGKFNEIREKAEEIAKMLSGLRSHLINKKSSLDSKL
jgi:four helix bundle protein